MVESNLGHTNSASHCMHPYDGTIVYLVHANVDSSELKHIVTSLQIGGGEGFGGFGLLLNQQSKFDEIPISNSTTKSNQ